MTAPDYRNPRHAEVENPSSRAALGAAFALMLCAVLVLLGLQSYQMLVVWPIQVDRQLQVSTDARSIAQNADRTATQIQRLIRTSDVRAARAVDDVVRRLSARPLDPALRAAVLDLCRAVDAPCRALRRQ